MDEKDKKKIWIYDNLKSLHEDISKSKDDDKIMACDAWIKIYNKILVKANKFATDDKNQDLLNNLKQDFKPFSITGSAIHNPVKWTTAIQTANELKYKIEELKVYISETIISSKNIPEIKLEDVIDTKGLISACKIAFYSGDYWNACLHAYIHLETKIRKKCNLSADNHGVALINKAFNSSTGILKIPHCKTTSEEDGFQLINRGFVLYHRNVKGHREGEIGKKDAIKIIAYVDYLIGILNTAVIRNSQQSS